MNKFTEGPWEATFTDCMGNPADYCRVRPVSQEMFGFSTSSEICDLYCMDAPEQQANARLIAAAPDLLEVLEAAVSLYDDWAQHRNDSDIEAAEDFLTWLEPARAAIAKARGTS